MEVYRDAIGCGIASHCTGTRHQQLLRAIQVDGQQIILILEQHDARARDALSELVMGEQIGRVTRVTVGDRLADQAQKAGDRTVQHFDWHDAALGGLEQFPFYRRRTRAWKCRCRPGATSGDLALKARHQHRRRWLAGGGVGSRLCKGLVASQQRRRHDTCQLRHRFLFVARRAAGPR